MPFDGDSDWTQVKLSDLIASLDAGVSVNSEGRPCASGEVGILKTSSVGGGRFEPSEHKVVLPSEVGRVKTPVLGNSIILSRMNTPALVGENGYVEEDNPTLYLPDRLWLLRTNKRADCRWLSYFMQSDAFRSHLDDIATGTSGSMKNISKARLAELPLSLPPLEEQRRIAQVLGSVDNTIAAAQEAEFQARRLYARLISHEMESVKLTHPLTRIGELCSVKRGASPRPIQSPKWFSASGPGWVRISDVTASRRLLLQTTQYLSEDGAACSVRISPGDLIMSICGTVGSPVFSAIHACIHDGFVVFKDINRSRLLEQYLYHYLKHLGGHFDGMSQPGTQRNLNSGIVSTTGIATPPVAVQQEIAERLDSAEGALFLCSDATQALLRVKVKLAQDLLSGSVRVAA